MSSLTRAPTNEHNEQNGQMNTVDMSVVSVCSLEEMEFDNRPRPLRRQ